MAVGPSWSWKLGSGGDFGGKRTKSGEGALRGTFGGVGVDGARSFACISSVLREDHLILLRGTQLPVL